MAVRAIPEGHNSVSPYLVVQGVSKLMDFLKATFDAKEVSSMLGPHGGVVHAELRVGDTIIMMGEPMGEFTAMPAQMHCYVEDVDATYARALKAGATSTREPADMFYGDRISTVKDAFGNLWSISTHKEDVTPAEMTKRMANMKG